jgi:hypothetical protein
MASTYSANLRLELIGTGEQQGTWGSTTNTNLGSLLEQAIGGYESVTVSNVGDTTLTTANGSVDQARNMTLNLVGTLTATRNVICPAAEKIYIVKNATTGGFAVTFKVTGQTGVSIPNGSTSIFYVDGTDARLVSQNPVPVTLGGTGATTAAAAATSLGLGTGDSPQFAGVNVGNASDTTITRSAAGVLAVEGGVIPKENRANTFTAAQTINGANLLLNSNSDYEPQTQLTHAGATAGSGAYSILNRARGTYTSPTIVSSGDQLGNVLFQGYDGTAYRSAASIEAQVDGTPGASDMPGRLTFKTAPDGSAIAFERMRITCAGDVGIGTTTALGIYGKLRVGGTGYQALNVGSDDASGVNVIVAANAASEARIGTNSNHPVDFYTNNLARMRVSAAGDVGIGTTAPANKFEVNGDNVASAARGATSAGQSIIEAQANDYWSGSTYTGTSLRQYGSTATGTTAGLSNANLGYLNFQNGSAGLIGTNGASPIVFMTTYTERMRLTANGGVSFGSSGTAYGTSGQILKSNGDAAPSWITTLPVANGGTGVTTSTGTGSTVLSASPTLTGTPLISANKIDAFPSGTRMLFQQTSAPTGWTKDVSQNDKALRIVNGSVTTGGTTAFSTVFASRTPAGTVGSTIATGSIGSTTATGTVGGTALTEAQLPSHRHFIAANDTVVSTPALSASNYVAYRRSDTNNSPNYTLTGTIDADATLGLSGATGSGSTHTHSLTMDAHSHTLTMDTHNHTFTGTALDFAVQYVDVIIAAKD